MKELKLNRICTVALEMFLQPLQMAANKRVKTMTWQSMNWINMTRIQVGMI